MRLRKKHFAIPEMAENPYVFLMAKKTRASGKKSLATTIQFT